MAPRASIASGPSALTTSSFRLKEAFHKATLQAHSDGTLSMTSYSGPSLYNALHSTIPQLKPLHMLMASYHSVATYPASNNKQT